MALTDECKKPNQKTNRKTETKPKTAVFLQNQTEVIIRHP